MQELSETRVITCICTEYNTEKNIHPKVRDQPLSPIQTANILPKSCWLIGLDEEAAIESRCCGPQKLNQSQNTKDQEIVRKLEISAELDMSRQMMIKFKLLPP